MSIYVKGVVALALALSLSLFGCSSQAQQQPDMSDAAQNTDASLAEKNKADADEAERAAAEAEEKEAEEQAAPSLSTAKRGVASFEYPSSWKVINDDERLIAVMSDDAQRAGILMTPLTDEVKDMNLTASLEETLLTMCAEEYLGGITGEEESVSLAKSELNGTSGYLFDSEIELSGRDFKVAGFVFIADDAAYLFDTWWPSGSSNDALVEISSTFAAAPSGKSETASKEDDNSDYAAKSFQGVKFEIPKGWKKLSEDDEIVQYASSKKKDAVAATIMVLDMSEYSSDLGDVMTPEFLVKNGMDMLGNVSESEETDIGGRAARIAVYSDGSNTGYATVMAIGDYRTVTILTTQGSAGDMSPSDLAALNGHIAGTVR